MKIYDGKNCAMGRVASKAVKEALKGETVEIYNAENIIITGNKRVTINRYKKIRGLTDRAKPEKSPILPRRPDLFVKKRLRGMLPWRSKRGKEAYKRIKVFMGEVPEGKKGEKIAELDKDVRFITIKEICKELGWNE